MRITRLNISVFIICSYSIAICEDETRVLTK